MPVLEDPHEGAVGGADGQQVDDDGLEGQEHRAQENEERRVGGHDHEGDGERRIALHDTHEIEIEGGGAGDQDLAVHGRVRGANDADEGARLVAARGVHCGDR